MHLNFWNLLWNPRSSQNGDYPVPFASKFSLVMPFLHECEHRKLMTSLMVNLSIPMTVDSSLGCKAVLGSHVSKAVSGTSTATIWAAVILDADFKSQLARGLSSSGSLHKGWSCEPTQRNSHVIADSDRICWIRAGCKEMDDQVDPFQQMSSPYIARGCSVHQHPTL